MKQPQSVFSCGKCDAQFSKWTGRCEACGAWGTVKEDVGADQRVGPSGGRTRGSAPTPAFASLSPEKQANRHPTGLSVWDRLLSGGLVSGSVTLVGGEPGIGKSTLLAQIALILASTGKSILYVTGEESPSQVALRLKRLSPSLPASLLFLDETDADTIAATISMTKPSLVIVDSVQSLRTDQATGESGNMNQVKASAAVVSEAARKSHVPVILVGQVTKDGELAGPRLLEHLVDTVVMMEGDRQHAFRLLRLLKHRFGTTEEAALLSMDEKGLQEVLDPSAALLADRPLNASGTVVSCLIEGSRPMMFELQALVTPAGYGTPLRRVSGVDLNRTALLLAVLARRAGVGFGEQDAFVNVIGGIDAKETGADLAICLALASAKADKPLPKDLAAWGEVGLAGELRPVSRMDARLKEAQRMGFTKCITPETHKTLRDVIRDVL